MQDPKNDNIASNLSFAWENVSATYEVSNDNLKSAMKAIEGTEVLIINGYSFPIFNRAVDAALIQKMKSLEKIYIQDKNVAKDVKQILETFVDNHKRNNIIDLGFYNQFYIPEMFIKPKPTLPLSDVANAFR